MLLPLEQLPQQPQQSQPPHSHSHCHCRCCSQSCRQSWGQGLLLQLDVLVWLLLLVLQVLPGATRHPHHGLLLPLPPEPHL